MTLQDLPLTDHTRTAVQTSMNNYQRHARLLLTVDTLCLPERIVFCTAHQTAPAVNGRNLTFEEIEQRAEEAFAPLALEGITPVISVYTVEDTNPAKPTHVHRKVRSDHDGKTQYILRQAQPRILFVVSKLAEATAGHLAENEKMQPEQVQPYLDIDKYCSDRN